jgi:hypothetical protein
MTGRSVEEGIEKLGEQVRLWKGAALAQQRWNVESSLSPNARGTVTGVETATERSMGGAGAHFVGSPGAGGKATYVGDPYSLKGCPTCKVPLNFDGSVYRQEDGAAHTCGHVAQRTETARLHDYIANTRFAWPLGPSEKPYVLAVLGSMRFDDDVSGQRFNTMVDFEKWADANGAKREYVTFPAPLDPKAPVSSTDTCVVGDRVTTTHTAPRKWDAPVGEANQWFCRTSRRLSVTTAVDRDFLGETLRFTLPRPSTVGLKVYARIAESDGCFLLDGRRVEESWALFKPMRLGCAYAYPLDGSSDPISLPRLHIVASKPSTRSLAVRGTITRTSRISAMPSRSPPSPQPTPTPETATPASAVGARWPSRTRRSWRFGRCCGTTRRRHEPRRPHHHHLHGRRPTPR